MKHSASEKEAENKEVTSWIMRRSIIPPGSAIGGGEGP
jgi:hypothetical protein